MEIFDSVTLSAIFGLTILSLVLAVFNFVILRKTIDKLYTRQDQIYARLIILTSQLEQMTGLDLEHPPKVDTDQILRNIEQFFEDENYAI